MKMRITRAVSTFLYTGISLSTLGILAIFSHAFFIFPSLGPTAFLLYGFPSANHASPKNTILGHAIGALCGYLSLVLFGLLHTPAAFISGLSPSYIFAAIFSLALTSLLMILFAVEHPPAGATTLIISLGVMHTLPAITVLMVAVVLLCLQAWIINHLRGIEYPIWSPNNSNQQLN